VVYPVRGRRVEGAFAFGGVLRSRSVEWARAALTSARLDPGVKRLGLETGIPTGAEMDPRISQDAGTRLSPGTVLMDPDLIADKEEGTLANLSMGLAVETGSVPFASFSTREQGEGVSFSTRV
jgi:hypothetical protein